MLDEAIEYLKQLQLQVQVSISFYLLQTLSYLRGLKASFSSVLSNSSCNLNKHNCWSVIFDVLVTVYRLD